MVQMKLVQVNLNMITKVMQHSGTVNLAEETVGMDKVVGLVSTCLYVKRGLDMKCLREFNFGLVRDSINVKISISWIITI